MTGSHSGSDYWSSECEDEEVDVRQETHTALPQTRQRFCNYCNTSESDLPVTLGPCHSCRDAWYCSTSCREADKDKHACKKSISDRSSFTRNCYILQSRRQNAEDPLQTITALTDPRRDQLLFDALERAESNKAETESILKQILRWNPSIGKQFQLKEAPFSASPLRMLHSSWEAIDTVGNEISGSFVALSYCWRTPAWHPVADPYHPKTAKEPVPICKSLWNFLLGLLESNEEAIWIDQLCLDQNDMMEKTSAVASMDALYACARLVFVALEDIYLTYPEVSILVDAFRQVAEDHDWIFSPDTARAVFAIVSKVFSARWFKRAWCFHEYHLATNRILAIPCETAPGEGIDSAIGLVNFGEFIFRLAYFQNEDVREENSELIQRMLGFFGGQDYAYSNIIANTFAYDSKYPRDKLTITLNICQIGLTLTEAATASDECRVFLLIAALAAGDATILTTRGSKLQYGTNPTKTSWLHWPDETSWSTRHPFPLPRGIISLTPDHIILDLLFVSETRFRRPSRRSLASAQLFLRSKFADQIRIAYGLQDKDASYVKDQGTIETLACALDCGFLWMVQAWHRIRGEVSAEVEQSFNAIQHLTRSSLRQLFLGITSRADLKPTWCLFRATRFPWRWQQREHKVRLPTRSTGTYRKMVTSWLLHPRRPRLMRRLITRAFEMLVCIILFGKYWEMGTSVVLNKSRSNRAICDLHLHKRNKHFKVPAPSEHKLYSEAKYTYHPKPETVLAVPRVLAGRRFGLSDRLWLMEPLKDELGRCWRVREKVCLLGCGRIRSDGVGVVLGRREKVVG